MTADLPADRISMVDAFESTLRGRMLMALARYEGAKLAFDEAVAEGRDVDAVIVPRQRHGSFSQEAAEASIRAARAKFGLDFHESPIAPSMPVCGGLGE